MAFTQVLRRQLGGGSTGPGLRTWELAARPWKAAQSCSSQQRAHLHHLFKHRTGPWRETLFRSFRGSRNVRWNSSKPPFNPTQHLGSPEPQSLSQRMRKLSKEYGWSALGIYFFLSALDFPFCFLAVRLLGTERIAQWEHAVIGAFWKVAETIVPNIRQHTKAVEEAAVEAGAVSDPADREGAGWGVEEAQARNNSESASIWTQLALAYAIHKSFIFVRVPLTAAVTPKVVKTLRSWGWNIGKRKPKSK